MRRYIYIAYFHRYFFIWDTNVVKFGWRWDRMNEIQDKEHIEKYKCRHFHSHIWKMHIPTRIYTFFYFLSPKRVPSATFWFFFFWMLLCPRPIRLNLTHDLMKIEKLTLPQIWYSPRIFKNFLNTSTFFLKTCIEFSLSLIRSPPFFSARQLDLWICSFFLSRKWEQEKCWKEKKKKWMKLIAWRKCEKHVYF